MSRPNKVWFRKDIGWWMAELLGDSDLAMVELLFELGDDVEELLRR